VNIFFDNCTSPILAETLDGFVRHEGSAAWHIRDLPGLPNGRHSTDLEWINYLRYQTDLWIFVTGDKRILKNPAERAALRSAGLHGFILAPAYQKSPIHQLASAIIWRWPDISNITKILSAPSMHEIPIGKSTKLNQTPF
jgi:hypothetical protein